MDDEIVKCFIICGCILSCVVLSICGKFFISRYLCKTDYYSEYTEYTEV